VADHPHDLSNKRCKSKRTTLRAFEIHRSPPLAGNLDKYLILKPYRRKIFDSVRVAVSLIAATLTMIYLFSVR
jgi:hypothetical protein